jgi:hypothetical protein
VRIGSDRLQIYEDQAVLVPIIIAFEIATKPFDDWGAMQDFTGLTIDNGDNPPDTDQLTIDGIAIDLGPLKMADFRIRTPIFTAVIPETDYGRSAKDFLEHPVPSGNYPAIVEGYFVLMTFEAGKRVLVHSWASAPRERAGPYFSELYYEIDVNKRKPKVSRGAPGFRLGHNEGIIKQILQQKKVNGEITPTEHTKYISNAKL